MFSTFQVFNYDLIIYT